MVKSYTKIVILQCRRYEKYATSDVLNLKLNEGLDAIQERGGTIISSSLVIAGGFDFVYHIAYEDNGNFEEINSYLQDVVFNFEELRLD